MKHEIITKKLVSNHVYQVTVKLKPENMEENAALTNLENFTASQVERDRIENYLHFSLGLGNYSIIEQVSQSGTKIVLNVNIM